MISAVYAGSFDPIHLGHEDIIKRGARAVDVLYVAVLKNENKNNLFSIDSRIEHVKEVTKNIKNVKVITFDGLLVDYVKSNDITYIIKGIRNQNDFQLEFDMAQNIRLIDESVETMFITSSPKYVCISSSIVKSVLVYSDKVKNMVSEYIYGQLMNRQGGKL